MKFIRFIIQSIQKIFFRKKIKKNSNIFFIEANTNIRMTNPLWVNSEEFSNHFFQLGTTGIGLTNNSALFSEIDLSNHVFFKKNPKWEMLFQTLLKKKEDSIYLMHLKNAERIIKTYNKELAKEDINPQNCMKMDPMEFIKIIKDFEVRKKITKEIKNALGKKYKNLYSNELFAIYEFYMNNKKESLKLINEYAKKISLKVKTSEELSSKINNYIADINGFSLHHILEKNKISKAKILFNKRNVIIIEIDNYQQMNNLGSKIWCISNDEKNYFEYKKENRQLIVYDFNKTVIDPNSIIGYTISKENGEVIHTFNAFNEKTMNDDSIREIIKNN